MQLQKIEAVSDTDAALATAYPLRVARLSHGLTHHPLLQTAALADAALAMDAAHVECRTSATAGFTDSGADKRRLMRHILDGDVDGWLMLRFADQISAYRDLLEDTLASYTQIIEPVTGPMRDPKAFIFLSSDQTVTPLHIDPTYNILFQISGTKLFSTYPLAPPVVTAEAEEGFHSRGDNLLPWNAQVAALGHDERLEPGDAIYVPHKLPHRVAVLGGLSISISMTWKSDWSMAEGAAHRANARLRALGWNPPPVARWPKTSRMRALAARILER